MNYDKEKLAAQANEIRLDIIKMIYEAGSGHPGGSLSIAELMAALYFGWMDIDPADPAKADRDKCILSKGHANPAQYSALARRGYFPVEELMTLRKLGSRLQGHPDMKKVPGIEVSTGSLGQGFSAGIGMALANKLDNNKGRIYVILGDGEIQEGIVWEAAMSAAHYGLDNICAIVDWNGLQISGTNDEVMKVSPIDDKFRSFGWNVITIDGHDFDQIFDALSKADSHKGQPTMILAKTVKGKGVSYMENSAYWHGYPLIEDDARKAISDLGGEW